MSRTPLPQTTVDEVKKLLRKKVPWRTIAETVGIHKDTVRRIKNGTNGKTKPNTAFCPVCRVTVRMPCLACMLRDESGRY